MKIGHIALALVFAFLAAGCSSPTTPAATTSTTPLTATILFTGALDVGGTNFTSFTVAQPGDTKVTLASLSTGLVLGTTSPPVASVVGLGVGVLSTDLASCVVGTSVNVAPSLTVQLTVTVPIGTTCVQVFDVGNLTGPVNFVIRVVHT